MYTNALNQPIGRPIKNYTAGQSINIAELKGRYCTVQRLNVAQHMAGLLPLFGPKSLATQWTYLPMEALPDENAVKTFLFDREQSTDPYMFVVKDNASNEIVGSISLMNINQAHRTIEIGWVIYGPKMEKSRIATEAQYLLMRYVFEELQYRRCEWKCDSLNEKSRKAALRLGFQFEGVFRNAMVYKNRNRDTAWFSMLPQEWEGIKVRFENWLHPTNFHAQSQQIKRLQDC